jgi:hypothetical protein
MIEPSCREYYSVINAHIHYMANLIRKTIGTGVLTINTWFCRHTVSIEIM